jgi:fumarate reductase flavoprotein subunit
MRFGKAIPLFAAALIALWTAQFANAQQTTGQLAQKHIKAGLTCKECHGNSIPSKQAGRPAPKVATKEKCLSCHGTYQEIAAKTKALEPPYNPHDSHYGALDCYQCHRMHSTQEMFCTQCHEGLKLPRGWKTAAGVAAQ